MVLISGCVQTAQEGGEITTTTQDQAKALCMQLCQGALGRGQDLSDGPCLSDNNPDWTINDWVCDVAHDPREAVDNDPANQCQEYRSGQAHHFVEVDPECDLIKAV